MLMMLLDHHKSVRLNKTKTSLLSVQTGKKYTGHGHLQNHFLNLEALINSRENPHVNLKHIYRNSGPYVGCHM